MKLKKSVHKRIRITKNGKIMRKSMSIDHFRTRQSTKALRRKKKKTGLDYPMKKIVNY